MKNKIKIAFLLIIVFTSSIGFAKTIRVTSFGDNGSVANDNNVVGCSLREAVQIIQSATFTPSGGTLNECKNQVIGSNGFGINDTILLPAGTIQLVDSINLSKKMTIQGENAEYLITNSRSAMYVSSIVRAPLPSVIQERAFVTGSEDITLIGIGVNGGHVTALTEGSTGGPGGGGIWAKGGGTLKLYYCFIHGNQAPRGGGMLVTSAEVQVIDSIFRDNVATGISPLNISTPQGGGGIFQEGGKLIIVGSKEIIKPYVPGEYIETRIDTTALNANLNTYFFLNAFGESNYTLFYNNQSYTGGSQLLINGGETFVSGTHFWKGQAMKPDQINSGPISEGTVFIRKGRVYFTKNTFSRNAVIGKGSGIRVTGGAGDVFIVENTFQKNANMMWSNASIDYIFQDDYLGVISIDSDVTNTTIAKNTFYKNELPAGVITLNDTRYANVYINNNFFNENISTTTKVNNVTKNSTTGLVTANGYTTGELLWPGISIHLLSNIESYTKIYHNTVLNDKGKSFILFSKPSSSNSMSPNFGGNLLFRDTVTVGGMILIMPLCSGAMSDVKFYDNVEWSGYISGNIPANPAPACFSNDILAPPKPEQSSVLPLYASAVTFYGPNQGAYATITSIDDYKALFRSRFAPDVGGVDQRNAKRWDWKSINVAKGNTVGSIELPMLLPGVPAP